MARNYRGVNTGVIDDPYLRTQLEIIDDFLKDVNSSLGALSKGNLPSSSNYTISPASGGGGGVGSVTSHFQLLNLAADDHPQYLNLNDPAYASRLTGQRVRGTGTTVVPLTISAYASATADMMQFLQVDTKRSAIDFGGQFVGAVDTRAFADVFLGKGLKISDVNTYWHKDVSNVSTAIYAKVLADLLTTVRVLHWPDTDGTLLTTVDTGHFIDDRGKAAGQPITNTFQNTVPLSVVGHASQNANIFQAVTASLGIGWLVDKNGNLLGAGGGEYADFRFGPTYLQAAVSAPNLLIYDGLTNAITVSTTLTAARTLTLQDDSGTVPLRNYYSGTAYESKTTAIARFTAYTTTHAGLYRVGVYVVDKVQTTPGTVTTRVYYTDRSGAQGPTTIAAAALTAVGIAVLASPMTIYCTSGSIIEFDNTIGLFVGTYDAYLHVEAI